MNLGIGLGGLAGGLIATTRHPHSFTWLYVIDACTFFGYIAVLAAIREPVEERLEHEERASYREVARDVAEADLRAAADRDLGDWFRFEIGAAAITGDRAVRLPVKAVIGATAWVEFHVDLGGSDLRMTGHPEDVPPVARGIIPHVDQRGYRAYPLVDHVADKVAATYERHGPEQAPSTRYRDVVDLVSIVTGASVSAGEQRLALESEFRRRGLTLPSSFDVPDRSLWEPGYAAEARRSLLTVGRTLDEALAIVRPFLDPLLERTAVGSWNRGVRAWIA